MIPFNRAPVVGGEIEQVARALDSGYVAGDGQFNRACERHIAGIVGAPRVLMTPSCTAALEMAALLVDIGPGDEVIMPSFTFVSTANAFALRGARIVFVDIDPITLNIDPGCVQAAISERTRAIVPVHYAGVSCDMDALVALANQHDLWVIEDAAQALGSRYHGEPVGRRGHLSAFSFHETKNLTAGGEGGALCVNDPALVERAEVIREKGTDRSKFFRGLVDKYSWVDIGSSFLLSDVQAACLEVQLAALDDINANRMATWNRYAEAFAPLADRFPQPDIPPECEHNAHLFHVRCADLAERTRVQGLLRERGVGAVFHYVPLHSAPAGRRFGAFHGEDRYTTRESERLLRLPLWYGMPDDAVETVIDVTRTTLQQVADDAGADRERAVGH